MEDYNTTYSNKPVKTNFPGEQETPPSSTTSSTPPKDIGFISEDYEKNAKVNLSN